MVWCKAYFDILNDLGVTHECDGRADITIANATRAEISFGNGWHSCTNHLTTNSCVISF